jgi:hypothetical protein
MYIWSHIATCGGVSVALYHHLQLLPSLLAFMEYLVHSLFIVNALHQSESLAISTCIQITVRWLSRCRQNLGNYYRRQCCYRGNCTEQLKCGIVGMTVWPLSTILELYMEEEDYKGSSRLMAWVSQLEYTNLQICVINSSMAVHPYASLAWRDNTPTQSPTWYKDGQSVTRNLHCPASLTQ